VVGYGQKSPRVNTQGYFAHQFLSGRFVLHESGETVAREARISPGHILKTNRLQVFPVQPLVRRSIPSLFTEFHRKRFYLFDESGIVARRLPALVSGLESRVERPSHRLTKKREAPLRFFPVNLSATDGIFDFFTDGLLNWFDRYGSGSPCFDLAIRGQQMLNHRLLKGKAILLTNVTRLVRQA
jgi:hypothetical protein